MAANTPLRITVPEHVLFRELDGEAVILDLNSENYFGLDEVGTRIWQHLTAEADFDAAVAAMLAEYEVQPDRLREDMRALVDELLASGLLEASGA